MAGAEGGAAASGPKLIDYATVFTNAKAGMDGVDKEKVKRIVYEASVGSRHFQEQQRKQAQVGAKVEQLKAKAAKLSPSELAAHARAVDAKVSQLELTRDLSRIW